MANYYHVLGVRKNATEEEIKSAYRQKATNHHPDVGKEGEQFKEIAEANAVLSDQEKRKEHDRGLATETTANAYATAHHLVKEFLDATRKGEIS